VKWKKISPEWTRIMSIDVGEHSYGFTPQPPHSPPDNRLGHTVVITWKEKLLDFKSPFCPHRRTCGIISICRISCRSYDIGLLIQINRNYSCRVCAAFRSGIAVCLPSSPRNLRNKIYQFYPMSIFKVSNQDTDNSFVRLYERLLAIAGIIGRSGGVQKLP